MKPVEYAKELLKDMPDFETDIENNNVVDDGIYINDEESVIVDDKDSPINNAVVDIGNFVTKIVRKVFEVIAGVVSKFVN